LPLSLRATIEIRAPAEVVFSVLCDPERLPEWNTSVEMARRAPGGEPVKLGSRAVFTGKLLGQRLESETEVVGFEPATLFATRAIRGPKLHSQFRLEPTDGGTRVQLDVSGEVPGGKLGSILAEGFLRSELSVSLQRLRACCEREVSVSS
jgi:uncharacterized protein YndB with AHSA1/START domain